MAPHHPVLVVVLALALAAGCAPLADTGVLPDGTARLAWNDGEDTGFEEAPLTAGERDEVGIEGCYDQANPRPRDLPVHPRLRRP